MRRAPLSRSRRPAIAQLPSVEQAESCRPDQKTHFLSRSLCNQLLKRILNRFRISGIWLQAHFEIIEDRLLVGFRRGDLLELQVAHHDLVAPDSR